MLDEIMKHSQFFIPKWIEIAYFHLISNFNTSNRWFWLAICVRSPFFLFLLSLKLINLNELRDWLKCFIRSIDRWFNRFVCLLCADIANHARVLFLLPLFFTSHKNTNISRIIFQRWYLVRRYHLAHRQTAEWSWDARTHGHTHTENKQNSN